MGRSSDRRLPLQFFRSDAQLSQLRKGAIADQKRLMANDPDEGLGVA
ncbi:MAG: hypothetical protein WBA57_14715 [Elainellaceae cyanobacterium]